jgi:hypothetical protein
VTGGNIQHLAELEGAADGAAANSALPGGERKRMHAYRRGRNAHEA